MKGEDASKMWQEAIISMIIKEEKECLNVKNFRPTSLLNIDYKIFVKVVAQRLKTFLKSYTGEDQVGFLPVWNIKDNLRTVLNILEYGDKQPGKKLVFFFLDAEKAFDNISWSFMKKVFREMRFGDKFVNASNSIYLNQSAAIGINNKLTE